jgi:zinc/manganese transport system substrate-binding protein/manganese/iron transport system substrate-binding protein
LLAIILLVTLFGTAACAGDDTGSGKLRVVAITTQIGDFAKNIGGDRIDLTVLLKPNQDAHDFEPQPSDIRALAGADLVLRHGLGLDAFIDKTLRGSKAHVVTVTDGIEAREGHEEADEGGIDPHVWFSVPNAVRMAENVRDALVAQDPDGAAVYDSNAEGYVAELLSLDGEIKAQAAQVPAACRKLVTNHDVLGYFGAAYGFEIVGSVIPSLATDAQPSAADVADIVRKVRDEDVPAIFAEASVNPALVRQVAREAGVKVVDDLYGDSLGTPGSAGGTYIGMMREDTRKIVDALSRC